MKDLHIKNLLALTIIVALALLDSVSWITSVIMDLVLGVLLYVVLTFSFKKGE